MPEVRCEFLDVPRFQQEAEFVFSTFEERPDDVLELQWGFGTNPDSFEPFNVYARDIRKLISDAAEQGVYEWGWADAYIKLVGDDLEIQLCHETDIHIRTNSEAWIQLFTDRWLKLGITWWRQESSETDWIKLPSRLL
jgi:hypothetical protein